MANNKDFKVKNGIKPTVYHEAVGTVTSGSVTDGYDLSVAAYDSKSFSTATQGSPISVAFKSDGTSMYILTTSPDSVFQYTLSTAWDVSTASYASKSFSVSSQGTGGIGITFKPDGTKMYLAEATTNDSLFEYDLSTAWDISTASYNSVSLSVSSQDSSPLSVIFNDDGTKLYVAGNTNDSIFQYSLTTAYDLSTASYDSVSFDVSTQGTNPRGSLFNADGTKMFVLDGTVDAIFQYGLTTGFDLSTASYDSVSFDVSSQATGPWGSSYSADGAKLYITDSATSSVYQYSTGSTVTTNTLDLSTGSVFEITPTSDIQINLSNPAASGTVSQATLLLDQVGLGPADSFSTDLYTGDGTTSKKITTDVDLSTDGGLVWIKRRSDTSDHRLIDTERGASSYLASNLTDAESTGALSSFDTDGFTIGNASAPINANASTYVAWSFKKQSSFFDVVTYTGDGSSNRSISHSLGSTPGFIIIKNATSIANWFCWHNHFSSLSSGSGYIQLNSTGAAVDATGVIDTVTSTSFNVTAGATNASGATFVAYLFAHDTSDDSNIKCGSYTGNGSTTGPEIDLGWDVQWLLVKNASASANWALIDTERGMPPSGSDQHTLLADSTAAELVNQSYQIQPITNGFQPISTNGLVNANGNDYIYVAIRGVSAPTITYPSTLEFAGGTAPTSPDVGETDVLTFSTTDGGTTYQAVQAIDGAKVMANDKDFIVKNAVEVGKDTKVTLGTITSSDIDLSTGNYFSDTLAANTTYTISNAGDVQSFQVEVTGGSAGYDLSAGVYDSKSFSVTSQETTPKGIAFKADGTKVYIVGNTSDTIYQYSLSTAWDISTASYDSVSFSTSGQEGYPTSLVFKSDGLKMFLMGQGNDRVYSYTLSTAWDVSTASYDSVFLTVTSQVTTPRGLSIKSDGTVMVVGDNADSGIHQYTLSTGWDLSTASYASKTFTPTGFSTYKHLFVTPDGTKMYLLDTGTNEVVKEFSLSTAWDISTASSTGNSIDVTAQDGTMDGMVFKSDGTKLYMLGNTGDNIYQYTTGSDTTLTWPTSIEFAGGVAPAAPANGETDLFTITTDDGGTTYIGTKTADALS